MLRWAQWASIVSHLEEAWEQEWYQSLLKLWVNILYTWFPEVGSRSNTFENLG